MKHLLRPILATDECRKAKTNAWERRQDQDAEQRSGGKPTFLTLS